MKARDAAIEQVQALLADNKQLAAAGKPIQMLYRMLYQPQDGLFKLMPEDLKPGSYVAEKPDEDGLALDATNRFVQAGQQYRVGDFVYLLPECAAL